MKSLFCAIVAIFLHANSVFGQIELVDIKAGFEENLARIYESPVTFQWHVRSRFTDESVKESDRIIAKLEELIPDASGKRKQKLQQMLSSEKGNKMVLGSKTMKGNLRYQMFYKEPGFRVRYTMFDEENIPFPQSSELFPPSETRTYETYTRENTSESDVVITTLAPTGVTGYTITDHDLSKIRPKNNIYTSPMPLKIDPEANVFTTPISEVSKVFKNPNCVKTLVLGNDAIARLTAVLPTNEQDRKLELYAEFDCQQGFLPVNIKTRRLAVVNGMPVNIESDFWSMECKVSISKLKSRNNIFYPKKSVIIVNGISVAPERFGNVVVSGKDLGNYGFYFTGPLANEAAFPFQSTTITVSEMLNWDIAAESPFASSPPEDARFMDQRTGEISISDEAARSLEISLRVPEDEVAEMRRSPWVAPAIFLFIAATSLVILFACKKKR